MKKTIISAACCIAVLGAASAASAATLNFRTFADGNEHGVADNTKITNFSGSGVDVTFSAAIQGNPSADAFAYFDHGGAGLGVCKKASNGVTFAGGLTGQGNGNKCNPSSDDNVTGEEAVTIAFDSAFTLKNLSFTGEGHNKNNPVYLETENARKGKTLLFGINGGALSRYSFEDLAAATFLGVTSATLAFDDANDPSVQNAIPSEAEQFYLASAVVEQPGTINLVPVPAALPLLLAGIGGLGFMARRKRKAT